MTPIIKLFIRGSLFPFLFATPCFASGPWVAAYDHLIAKVGFDFYHSAENIMDDGSRQNLILANQLTTLTQDKIWVEGEYGIADHWETILRATFVHNQLDANGGPSLFTGNGVPDIRAAVKWNVLPGQTPITLEANVKIPLTSTAPSDPYSLVVGDGNLDVGFIFHLGHREGSLYFSISPGILIRSTGYSQAATLNAAVEWRFKPVYVSLFTDAIYSFAPTPFRDTSLLTHDAIGSGGSYALLNGSPTGTAIGGKVGVRFPRDIVFEGQVSHSIAGNRFPYFFDVGCALSIPFNFYVPEKKIKVREIPLDQETPAKSEG